MKIDLTGIHLEVSEGMKQFVDQKVNKLSKFFPEDTLVHVTIRAEKDKQHVDIRIETGSHTFIGEENTTDTYAAIDKIVSKIEGQARKLKDKKENMRYDSVEVPSMESEEE